MHLKKPYTSPILGEIRKASWTPYPVRVLAFDDVEVLYDVWWPDEQWAFGTSARKCNYYRQYTKQFCDGSVRIGLEPLTNAEHALHRPDLPIRMYRDPRVSWNEREFTTLNEFETFVAGRGMRLSELAELPLARIALTPSPMTERSRPTTLSAGNGVSFAAREILWHAYRLQFSHVDLTKHGIGIYRIGLNTGGVPKFISGAYSDFEPISGNA